MKSAWIIAAALALTACGPSQPEAPAPEPTPTADQNSETSVTNSLAGWLVADGPGETAAVWRETPDSVEFSLTCSMSDRMLSVLAKKPIDKIVSGTPASLFIGDSEFKTVATAIDDARQVGLKTPVTTAVLKALSIAKTARIEIGGAFTATGIDDKNTLADLAVSCAAITNVPAQ